MSTRNPAVVRTPRLHERPVRRNLKDHPQLLLYPPTQRREAREGYQRRQGSLRTEEIVQREK
jgi:hypothetical protein